MLQRFSEKSQSDTIATDDPTRNYGKHWDSDSKNPKMSNNVYDRRLNLLY